MYLITNRKFATHLNYTYCRFGCQLYLGIIIFYANSYLLQFNYLFLRNVQTSIITGSHIQYLSIYCIASEFWLKTVDELILSLNTIIIIIFVQSTLNFQRYIQVQECNLVTNTNELKCPNIFKYIVSSANSNYLQTYCV